jgi:hypothetical protein
MLLRAFASSCASNPLDLTRSREGAKIRETKTIPEIPSLNIGSSAGPIQTATVSYLLTLPHLFELQSPQNKGRAIHRRDLLSREMISLSYSSSRLRGFA